MFGKPNIEIHPNLENYLKAIWRIARAGRVVRVKDLAASLGLKNGTVVSGLKTLAGKGLVIHQHYGHVELTHKGTLGAMHMVNRHAVLREFLGDILKLTDEQAERDSCALEHYISEEGLHRLIHFAEFIRDQGDLPAIHRYLQSKVSPEALPLSAFKVGEFARVAEVGGERALKRRLLDMGIVPGAEVRVEKTAPLGDPLELVLNGVHLTLRRGEAEAVKARRRDLIPLAGAARGLYHIEYLLGGRQFIQEAESLRLTPGQAIEVLEPGGSGGALQIKVEDARLVLGGGMAEKIFVAPYHDGV
jgi:DtxR family Mn-dependent transcriptional regulator